MVRVERYMNMRADMDRPFQWLHNSPMAFLAGGCVFRTPRPSDMRPALAL